MHMRPNPSTKQSIFPHRFPASLLGFPERLNGQRAAVCRNLHGTVRIRPKDNGAEAFQQLERFPVRMAVAVVNPAGDDGVRGKNSRKERLGGGGRRTVVAELDHVCGQIVTAHQHFVLAERLGVSRQ